MQVEKKAQKNAVSKNVLPDFNIEDLVKNGVHFGHKVSSWNHKMKPYIFGARNNTHIIDVRKTYSGLQVALKHLYKSVKSGQSVLFVSTKKSVRDIVREHAIKCGQPYVTCRWLGGILTNWRTIVLSIKKIKRFEKILSEVDEKGRHSVYAKKELNVIRKDLEKLKIYFDGLKGVTARPDVVVVFDTNKDRIAVQEADKLCITSIGLADTNSNIDKLSYVIPCNDDSRKSVDMVAGLISQTILNAIKDEVASYNIDTKISAENAKNKSIQMKAKIKEAMNKGESPAPEKSETTLETSNQSVDINSEAGQ